MILDDDKIQLEYLKNLLQSEYECETFSNPIEAIKSFKEKTYHGIITDLHMPIVNGVEFIRKIIPNSNSSIPILVFSNDISIQSKVECLKLGIRDYLNTGMDDKEIMLRVKNNFNDRGILKFEKILIDEKALQVYLDDSVLDVTQIEYKILLCLLRHQGQMPKKNLISFIWPTRFVLDKTLNTHMTNLRNKMKLYNYTLQTTKEDVVVIIPRLLNDSMTC